MDIVFRTRSKSHIYTVILFTENKRGCCKVEYSSKDREGKRVNWKPNEFSAMEMEEVDLKVQGDR